MQTTCPHCHTTFRVTDEQLSAAAGKVRCGRCFGVFVAVEPHIDQPPVEPEAEQIFVSETPTAASTEPFRIASDIDEITTETPAISTRLDDDLLDEISQRDATPPRRRGVMLPLVASLLLCTTLSGQYLYFNRDQLAQDPQMRPYLAEGCQHLAQLSGELIPCQLAPLRAPQHIALTQREVRAHPEYTQTLLVSARFNNQADFAQAYPLLELTFQDVNGVTVFARRFKAEEYLANGLQAQQEIGAQQTAEIQLELVDPGPQAVGYEFNFL